LLLHLEQRNRQVNLMIQQARYFNAYSNFILPQEL
jgi:hypothetical protein